jgi:hypothetical protein
MVMAKAYNPVANKIAGSMALGCRAAMCTDKDQQCTKTLAIEAQRTSEPLSRRQHGSLIHKPAEQSRRLQ